MSNIVKLDFEGHAVRQVEAVGGTEWVAKDVCEVLELKNPSQVISTLDDDEKGLRTVDTLGGPQEMATVTEAGLYALISRSRKPAAKRFRRWVNHEVLPSIRKTGGYVAPGHEHEFALQLMATLELQRKTIDALSARLDAHDREHPYGQMGPRDAAALAGQIREIRDLLLRLGDPRKPRAIRLVVDRTLRARAGYLMTPGAKWEFATASQSTTAFSHASQWIAALRKDLKTMRAQPLVDGPQLGLVN